MNLRAGSDLETVYREHGGRLWRALVAFSTLVPERPGRGSGSNRFCARWGWTPGLPTAHVDTYVAVPPI